MKDILSGVSGFIVLAVMFIGVGLLAWLLIQGGVWLAVKLLPWGQIAVAIVTIVMVLILLPLSLFKKMKGWTGAAFMYGSLVYGVVLWFWSLLLAYVFWGWLAVFIGLFLMGVGVVPVALLALVFHGEWPLFLQMLIAVALTFGSRMYGYYLVQRAEEISYAHP